MADKLSLSCAGDVDEVNETPIGELGRSSFLCISSLELSRKGLVRIIVAVEIFEVGDFEHLYIFA